MISTVTKSSTAILVALLAFSWLISAPSYAKITIPLKIKGNACIQTGCSKSICIIESDNDDNNGNSSDKTISTCEWREHYACFQDGGCSYTPMGTCGWDASVGSCLNSFDMMIASNGSVVRMLNRTSSNTTTVDAKSGAGSAVYSPLWHTLIVAISTILLMVLF